MGPLVWDLRPLREFLGALRVAYRVYRRYRRIPGLRAHTRGPWFQPSLTAGPLLDPWRLQDFGFRDLTIQGLGR